MCSEPKHTRKPQTCWTWPPQRRPSMRRRRQAGNPWRVERSEANKEDGGSGRGSQEEWRGVGVGVTRRVWGYGGGGGEARVVATTAAAQANRVTLMEVEPRGPSQAGSHPHERTVPSQCPAGHWAPAGPNVGRKRSHAEVMLEQRRRPGAWRAHEIQPSGGSIEPQAREAE